MLKLVYLDVLFIIDAFPFATDCLLSYECSNFVFHVQFDYFT